VASRFFREMDSDKDRRQRLNRIKKIGGNREKVAHPIADCACLLQAENSECGIKKDHLT
jgi:hypothetical protein